MRPLATDRETICALATAHGTGAIAVIRMSGERAVEVTRQLAPFLPPELESHKIYYGILHAPHESRALDEVLISYFAAGRSFTGEACIEISCHGSPTVIDEIIKSLILAGARPAERGEFTYRAFMSGRIDLVQAESVLSLIESRSTRAAQMALRQLQGVFSNDLQEILKVLTHVLANLEANIDFAAEDIQVASGTELWTLTEGALRRVQTLLLSYRQGKLIRDGFQVALVGPPNVGKSSLLNALVKEERAIVTSVAGTTRDFVEAQLNIDGLMVTVIDTAGLRVTDDPVEKVGVQRTLDKLKSIDLVLFVLDGTNTARSLTEIIGEPFLSAVPWGRAALVINKIDLLESPLIVHAWKSLARTTLPISATYGQGLDELWQWIREQLQGELAEDSTLISNARHFNGLTQVETALQTALPLLRSGGSPDLIALELQAGLSAIFAILGQTFDDQVMDQVFAQFCLGK